MITILNGKLTIPESERFIGFAGDNLRRKIEFLVSGIYEADRIYRIYLTFDDGTVNYFTLPFEVTDLGVVLTWDVLREHIFKSGCVKVQIKAFSDNGVVWHTNTERFIVGESTELTEEFAKQNTEFLRYEERLNNLSKEISEICVLMPFVGDNGNWYIYDAQACEYKDSGKPSVAIADGVKISDGDIDKLSLFSPEMVQKYLSLPVYKCESNDPFSEEFYNTLTEQGIYKLDSLSGVHQVVVVLSPNTSAHLMQIKFEYNQIRYRGIWCTEDGKYPQEDWEEWTTLNVKVDLNLDSNSENPVSNKAVSEALGKKMSVAKSFVKAASVADDTDPQLIAYQEEDVSVPEMLRIPLSVLMKKIKSVADSGNYFESDTVEAVLQEIGAKLLKFTELKSIYDNEPELADPNNTGLLSNVTENSIFMASNSHWTDTPNNETVIFINLRYSLNYDVQIGISIVNSGVIYTRVIHHSKRTVFKDWGTASVINQSDTQTPLKVLAVGDSICTGSGNSGKGYADYLGLECRNAAVGMATISNFRTTVTNIPDQLTGVTDFTPDVIIAEGGVNDYYYHVPLGTLSASPVSSDAEANSLDRNTFLGALEYLFYKMIKLRPKAQRFFLITHKTYATACNGATDKAYWVTHKNNAGYTQQDMHDAIVECCRMYNVGVIDVFEEGLINTLYSEYMTGYVGADGIHPLEQGYKEAYVPLIKKALAIGTVKNS